MKFSTTILTAVVLLGLCVLEKKAKENMTIKVMEENSQKTFLTYTGSNRNDFGRYKKEGSDSQQRVNQNLPLLTMTSSDSSSLFSPLFGKTLMNLSIGEFFASQP